LRTHSSSTQVPTVRVLTAQVLTYPQLESKSHGPLLSQQTTPTGVGAGACLAIMKRQPYEVQRFLVRSSCTMCRCAAPRMEYRCRCICMHKTQTRHTHTSARTHTDTHTHANIHSLGAWAHGTILLQLCTTAAMQRVASCSAICAAYGLPSPVPQRNVLSGTVISGTVLSGTGLSGTAIKHMGSHRQYCSAAHRIAATRAIRRGRGDGTKRRATFVPSPLACDE
jgi:hypothetical protein